MKPSAPPAPPRRHSSGIRPPEEQSPPTQNYGEPPTMAAARARIHEIARELPAENRFSHNERHNFNDETQGRIEPVDFAAAHAAYDRQFGTPPLGSPDAYDQLPALGHHEHYDAEYQHQDPMTELRPAYDEALERHADNYRAEPQPYRNDEHQYRSDRPLPEDDSSGEYARRERRSPPPPATYSAASNSYDPAAYEANYPKASRREEPSYADRREHVSSAPKSDRRERHEERREEGRSFRRDDFPRESSYRDEPRRDDRDERRDEGRSFRREEARREAREASYQPPRADETRAEGSSAKHEKRGDSGFDRDRHEPSIPGPAGVPRELRVPENFVVGVQPIRTPSMGAASAFPQPQAVIAPSYPPAMTAAASPGAMNMNMPMSPMTGGPSLGQMGMPVIPQISMPPMMAPMAPMTAGMPPMHVRAHTSARPMGHIPQPTEVEEAQQGSKVGRFAWFVFGAAFGIFFAFAATGFGFGKKDDASFPPAPTQLPAPPTAVPAPPPPPPVQPQLAPAPVAPQPGQPMMAQPQAPAAVPGQPPQMLPQQQLAPVAAPQFAPAGVTVAPGQAPISIVPAPGNVQQPQAQGGQAQPPAPRGGTGTVTVRDTPPRRPAGGARRGGGSARPAAPQNNNDDDAPAPKPKAEPSAADLLGDGLK